MARTVPEEVETEEDEADQAERHEEGNCYDDGVGGTRDQGEG